MLHVKSISAKNQLWRPRSQKIHCFITPANHIADLFLLIPHKDTYMYLWLLDRMYTSFITEAVIIYLVHEFCNGLL